MNIIRLLLKVPFVIAAALAGNQVGYLVREQYLGKESHHLRFFNKGEDDEITIAINPMMTNFIPAVLVGLLTRPGVVTAFLSGAIIGATVGDDYESQFWAMLGMDNDDEAPAA